MVVPRRLGCHRGQRSGGELLPGERAGRGLHSGERAGGAFLPGGVAARREDGADEREVREVRGGARGVYRLSASCLLSASRLSASRQ